VFHGFADLQNELPDMAERLYGTMVRTARLLSDAQNTEEADA
jgi:hypothetical protein